MTLPVAGQVGPAVVADGVTTQPFRQGRGGEIIASELQGRFYEQAFRGTLFSGGMTLTSINNATFTSGTLGATATPIAGIWNPGNSTINAAVLQAVLAMTVTALINTGGGPYVWAASVGNLVNPITTGLAPWNRKTLTQQGSQVKNMAGVALTGLANNLIVIGGSALGGGRFSNINGPDTAVGWSTTLAGFVENLDGSIIVPPGGVLALLATTTPVAHSAASNLLWSEAATT